MSLPPGSTPNSIQATQSGDIRGTFEAEPLEPLASIELEPLEPLVDLCAESVCNLAASTQTLREEHKALKEKYKALQERHRALREEAKKILSFLNSSTEPKRNMMLSPEVVNFLNSLPEPKQTTKPEAKRNIKPNLERFLYLAPLPVLKHNYARDLRPHKSRTTRVYSNFDFRLLGQATRFSDNRVGLNTHQQELNEAKEFEELQQSLVAKVELMFG